MVFYDQDSVPNLAIPVSVITAIFFCPMVRRNTNKKKQPPPIDHLFENYTSGIFFNKLYKWGWKKDELGSIRDISPLLPHCQKCDVYIVNDKCPECGKKYSFDMDEKAKVFALIIGKIGKGKFPN